jgi:HEAT repeat protein
MRFSLTLPGLLFAGLTLFAVPQHAHGNVQKPLPPTYGGPGVLAPGRVPLRPPGTPRGAPPRAPGTAPTTGPGGPMPGGGNPGSGGVSSGPSSSWFTWWQFNREPFLQLRSHLDADPTRSGGDGYFLGRGERFSGPRAERGPTDDEIRRRVLPTLLRALSRSPSNDLATACLIALARIGKDRPDSERQEIERVVRTFLRDPNQEVSETAVVALGILGTDSAALLLGDILLEAPAARTALGQENLPERSRAFAAFALGILGHRAEKEDVRRFIVHKLARALELEEQGGSSPDVEVACVVAIGRVPLPWRGGTTPEAKTRSKELPPVTSRETQLLRLLAPLSDRGAHRYLQAHAAVSLGALLSEGDAAGEGALADEVVDALVGALLGKSRASSELTWSAAIALGMIGDDDEDPRDVLIRETLLVASEEASNNSTRYLATMALGRVGARRGSGSAAPLTPIRERLLGVLSRGKSDARQWAALSLAILERGRSAWGEPVHPDSRQALHAVTREARAPAEVAAFSLATGLLRHPAGGEILVEQLGSVRDETTRGFVALGLGLLEDRRAVDVLRPLVQESAYRPTLLQDVCIALALLSDRGAVDILIENLRAVRSLAAQASIARALGRIGGSEAVEPLAGLLESEESTDAARALAAIALGLVADRDALPWNTILSVDSNYLAAPPTLHDQQGFGILNIL